MVKTLPSLVSAFNRTYGDAPTGVVLVDIVLQMTQSDVVDIATQIISPLIKILTSNAAATSQNFKVSYLKF